MRSLKTMGSLFALVMFTQACGLSSNNARCDLRPNTPQCTDWRNSVSPVWATQEAICKTLGVSGAGGTFKADATCDVTDMWGGCQTTMGDGSLQTNWLYKGEKHKTLEDAKADCDTKQANTKWVDPA